MTRILLIVVLICLIANKAYADQFRIVDRRNANMGYASVSVEGKEAGYTDKFGRITINLPKGSYVGEVDYRGQRKKIRLNIDGSSRLKTIRVD